MFKELETIVEALEDIKFKKKRSVQLSKDLNQKRIEQEAALKKLEKENKDVDKVAGVSFTSFMATIMNNRSERLEKEELEALEAKQKYDAITYEVEALNEELASLASQISKEKELENAYQKSFEEKKTYMMAESPQLWDQIQKLDKSFEHTSLEVKEIKEAIHACQNVQRSLNIALKELNDARAMGTWDMLGGGMLATMVKRDHMNKAQSAINDLNYKLKRFSKELSDINEEITSEIQIDQFMSFADYFFDGLFMDIMVQNKIKEAQSKVEILERDINRLDQKLNTMYINAETHRKQMKSEIDAIVLSK